jgi:pSer/pThr/pTyr-binding forkhead associated (FHA) protein
MSSRPSKPAPATQSGGGPVFHASLVPIGQHAGQPAFALYRPVIVVGSGKKPHILLNDPTVSHSHAVLIQTRQGVYFRDLASRTHTILNAKSQKEGLLKTGDTLTIGTYSFIFNTSQQVNPAAPRAAAGALDVAGEPFPSPIDGRSVLIGNRRGCEIRISDDEISTTHALVFELDGRRFIRDLNSRTGTFLNGKAVHQAELNFGDEIRVGKTVIRYVPDQVQAFEDDAPAIAVDEAPLRVAPLIPATVLEAPATIDVPEPADAPIPLVEDDAKQDEAAAEADEAAPLDRDAIHVAGDATVESDEPIKVDGLELLPIDRGQDPLGLDEPTTVPVARDEVEVAPLDEARTREGEAPAEPLRMRDPDASDRASAGSAGASPSQFAEPTAVEDEQPVIPIGRRSPLDEVPLAAESVAEPETPIEPPLVAVEPHTEIEPEAIDPVSTQARTPLIDLVDEEPESTSDVIEIAEAPKAEAIEPIAPVAEERSEQIELAPAAEVAKPIVAEELAPVERAESLAVAPEEEPAPAQAATLDVVDVHDAVEVVDASEEAAAIEPAEPVKPTEFVAAAPQVAEVAESIAPQQAIAQVVESVSPEQAVADVVESVVEAKRAEPTFEAPVAAGAPTVVDPDVLTAGVEPLPILPSVAPEIEAAVNLPPPTETDVPAQRLLNDASRRARLLYELLEQTEVIEEEAEKEAAAIGEELANLPLPDARELTTPVTLEKPSAEPEAPAAPVAPAFEVPSVPELPPIAPVVVDEVAPPPIPFVIDEPARPAARLPETIDFAAPPVDELPAVLPPAAVDEVPFAPLDFGFAAPAAPIAEPPAMVPADEVVAERAPEPSLDEPTQSIEANSFAEPEAVAVAPLSDIVEVAEASDEPMSASEIDAEIDLVAPALVDEAPVPSEIAPSLSDEIAVDATPFAEAAAEATEAAATDVASTAIEPPFLTESSTNEVEPPLAPDEVLAEIDLVAPPLTDEIAVVAETSDESAVVDVAALADTSDVAAPAGPESRAAEDAIAAVATDAEAPALPLADADDAIELDAAVDAEAVPDPDAELPAAVVESTGVVLAPSDEATAEDAAAVVASDEAPLDIVGRIGIPEPEDDSLADEADAFDAGPTLRIASIEESLADESSADVDAVADVATEQASLADVVAPSNELDAPIDAVLAAVDEVVAPIDQAEVIEPEVATEAATPSGVEDSSTESVIADAVVAEPVASVEAPLADVEEPVAPSSGVTVLDIVDAESMQTVSDLPLAEPPAQVVATVDQAALDATQDLVFQDADDEESVDDAFIATALADADPLGEAPHDDATLIELPHDSLHVDPHARPLIAVDDAHLDDVADDSEAESIIAEYLEPTATPIVDVPETPAAEDVEPLASEAVAEVPHVDVAEEAVADVAAETAAVEEQSLEPTMLVVEAPSDVVEATQSDVEASPAAIADVVGEAIEVADEPIAIAAESESTGTTELPVVALDVPASDAVIDAVAVDATQPLESIAAETALPIESTHDEPAEIAAALAVPVEPVDQVIDEPAPVAEVIDVTAAASDIVADEPVTIVDATAEVAEPVVIDAEPSDTDDASTAMVVAPALDLPVPDLDTFDLPPLDVAAPAVALDEIGPASTVDVVAEPRSTAAEPVVVTTEPPMISAETREHLDEAREAVAPAAEAPKAKPFFDASILDAWDTDELGRPISGASAAPVAPRAPAPKPAAEAPGQRKAPIFDASILDTWDLDPATSKLSDDATAAPAAPAAKAPEPAGGDGFLNLGGIGWIGLPELDEFEKDTSAPPSNEAGPRPARRQTPSMLPPLTGHRRRRRPVKPIATDEAAAPAAPAAPAKAEAKPITPAAPASVPAEPTRGAAEPTIADADRAAFGAALPPLPSRPPSDVPVRKLRGPRQRKPDEAPIVDDATAEDSPVVPASPFAESEVPLVDVFGQAPRAGLDEVLAKLNANPANAEVAEELKKLLDQPPNGSPRDPVKGVVEVNGASPFAAGEAPINAAVPTAEAVPPPPTRRRNPRSLATLIGISALLSGTLGAYFFFNTKVEDQIVGQVTFKRGDRQPLSPDQFRVLRELVKVQLGTDVAVAAGQKVGDTYPHDWETSGNSLQEAWNPDQTVQGGRLRRNSSPYTRDADRARMNAVLRALYEVNQPRQAEVQQLMRKVAAADDAIAKLNEQKRSLDAQIDELTRQIKSRPDITRQINEARQQEADARQQLDKVLSEQESVESELNRLKGELAGIGGSEAGAPVAAGDAPPVDSQLAALQSQLDAAKKQLDDLTVARTDDSKKARSEFDDSIQAFAKEVDAAKKNLANRPEFLATVDSARQLADQVRDLTDKLVRRQEQQLTDMAELKRQLAELAGSQEEQRYASDPQLQTMNEQLQILERRMNVARADGNADEASTIEQQMSTLRTSIAARKDLLDDPKMRALAQSLQSSIERRQKDMADDRAENEKLLATMQKDFLDRLGAIEQMPADQQTAARQLTDKLAAIAFARQNYAAAVEKQADVPAEQLAAARRQVDSLTQLVDARKTELAAVDAQASQLATRRAELQRRIALAETRVKQIAERDVPQAKSAVAVVEDRIKGLNDQQTEATNLARELSAATAQREKLAPATVGTIGEGEIARATSERNKLAASLGDVVVMQEPDAAAVIEGGDNRLAYGFGSGVGTFLVLLMASLAVRQRQEMELANESIRDFGNAVPEEAADVIGAEGSLAATTAGANANGRVAATAVASQSRPGYPAGAAVRA